MDVPITKVIGTCMSLGIMVTMNQRLDAETLTIVADEFGYEVEFITVDIEDSIAVVEDREEDLVFRAHCYCNGSRRSRYFVIGLCP
jgi:translation initiation factor IF-2